MTLLPRGDVFIVESDGLAHWRPTIDIHGARGEIPEPYYDIRHTCSWHTACGGTFGRPSRGPMLLTCLTCLARLP